MGNCCDAKVLPHDAVSPNDDRNRPRLLLKAQPGNHRRGPNVSEKNVGQHAVVPQTDTRPQVQAHTSAETPQSETADVTVPAKKQPSPVYHRKPLLRMVKVISRKRRYGSNILKKLRGKYPLFRRHPKEHQPQAKKSTKKKPEDEIEVLPEPATNAISPETVEEKPLRMVAVATKRRKCISALLRKISPKRPVAPLKQDISNVPAGTSSGTQQMRTKVPPGGQGDPQVGTSKVESIKCKSISSILSGMSKKQSVAPTKVKAPHGAKGSSMRMKQRTMEVIPECPESVSSPEDQERPSRTMVREPPKKPRNICPMLRGICRTKTVVPQDMHTPQVPEVPSSGRVHRIPEVLPENPGTSAPPDNQGKIPQTGMQKMPSRKLRAHISAMLQGICKTRNLFPLGMNTLHIPEAPPSGRTHRIPEGAPENGETAPSPDNQGKIPKTGMEKVPHKKRQTHISPKSRGICQKQTAEPQEVTPGVSEAPSETTYTYVEDFLENSDAEPSPDNQEKVPSKIQQTHVSPKSRGIHGKQTVEVQELNIPGVCEAPSEQTYIYPEESPENDDKAPSPDNQEKVLHKEHQTHVSPKSRGIHGKQTVEVQELNIPGVCEAPSEQTYIYPEESPENDDKAPSPDNQEKVLHKEHQTHVSSKSREIHDTKTAEPQELNTPRVSEAPSGRTHMYTQESPENDDKAPLPDNQEKVPHKKRRIHFSPILSGICRKNTVHPQDVHTSGVSEAPFERRTQTQTQDVPENAVTSPSPPPDNQGKIPQTRMTKVPSKKRRKRFSSMFSGICGTQTVVPQNVQTSPGREQTKNGELPENAVTTPDNQAKVPSKKHQTRISALIQRIRRKQNSAPQGMDISPVPETSSAGRTQRKNEENSVTSPLPDKQGKISQTGVQKVDSEKQKRISALINRIIQKQAMGHHEMMGQVVCDVTTPAKTPQMKQKDIPEKNDNKPPKDQGKKEETMAKMEPKKCKLASAITKCYKTESVAPRNESEPPHAGPSRGLPQRRVAVPDIKELFCREEEFRPHNEGGWEEYESYFPGGVPIPDSKHTMASTVAGSYIAQVGSDLEHHEKIDSKETFPDAFEVQQWELRKVVSTIAPVLNVLYVAPPSSDEEECVNTKNKRKTRKRHHE